MSYKSTVVESSRELTFKERVKLGNLSDAIVLGTAAEVEPVTIDVDCWVIVHIENDKSDDKEYDNFVIISKDGTMYYTGSESFWTSFTPIWEAACDHPEEQWQLVVNARPSKNRQGKTYLDCTIQ